MVDRYRLQRLLGVGGMGAVYEAAHAVVGKRCAIKLLHQRHARNPEVTERMLREARAAAAIGHPNIVDIYDFGQTPDGITFLVMEYLEGQNLATLIGDPGPLEVKAAVAIVLQVLSALVAAHDKGIVHRDLKPENIFLARSLRRRGDEVKLLDFGISKFVSQPNLVPLTHTGMVIGSPSYMSPEQAAANPVDARADLWTVGVVLYEALTTELPFDGADPYEVIRAILQQDPSPPRTYRPELPAPLEQVILKALKRDPAERWQSAAQMIEALLPFYDRDVEVTRFVLRSSLRRPEGGPVAVEPDFGAAEVDLTPPPPGFEESEAPTDPRIARPAPPGLLRDTTVRDHLPGPLRNAMRRVAGSAWARAEDADEEAVTDPIMSRPTDPDLEVTVRRAVPTAAEALPEAAHEREDADPTLVETPPLATARPVQTSPRAGLTVVLVLGILILLMGAALLGLAALQCGV